MRFEELLGYLESKMRLQHIYQPLLVEFLVESDGSATIRQIATAFLSRDESQITYYERRLKDKPLEVLSKNGVVTRAGNLLTLNVGKLTLEQKAEIKKVCEEKIQEYVKTRGISIWDYRMLDTEQIPDSLRYRVLKEAKGRCSLCGSTIEEAPLDVDHIIPRSRGGMTVYENLQALCAKCNRSKRDTDETDFRHRNVKSSPGCLFCERKPDIERILENDHAYAVLDRFPVSKGHTLVIPKRHFSNFFEITKVEYDNVFDLLCIRQKQLLETNPDIQGFNIGVNSGEVAGQTIPHCHVHLIPRRPGDVEDPRGGVRAVIPTGSKYPDSE
jgi:ATP adenylyltransferase